jgi:uncharacterized damage-inducible protein DinB
MSLVKRIGQYMLWADHSIWKIVQSLTDEEFHQSFSNFGGSIYEKFIHMAEGHSSWYHRWTGVVPDDMVLRDLPRKELFEFLIKYNQKILNLQTETQDTKELGSSQGSLFFSTDEMVFNIINHATYHRGQIVLMLRLIGKEVHPTDYFPFLIEATSE